MHIENIENWDHKLYQSAIIFTESLKNLNNLHKKSINTHTFDLTLQNALPKQFKFLTYIEEVEFIYIPEYKIFDYIYYRWPDMRMFQIFITMNQVSINLTAHVLFSPNMCEIFHLKHLNSFDLKTQKWNNELKNFNHFDNFYGCLMTFFVEDGIFWYFVDHNLVNYLKFAFENIKFHGLTHEILEKLTKDLNITGHYTYFDKTSKQYQSGSKNFIGYDAIASYFYSSEIVKNETTVHWSQPVYTMEIYYLVTQNDLYTNYEKLLMPFDFTTWIFLSVTINLAFGIILISF
ncbi:hypothetical protein PVAND_016856 [Polypedilum vanderplanki]|uniref:Uncharacterized protein n=1 Tax=Polypedilum vanderplanki TaxID=319348 RepID=A0A9J6BHL9_POLVA|nr:hypothetical protein PVAND_016856 [Polypedilum vanderplanki]